MATGKGSRLQVVAEQEIPPEPTDEVLHRPHLPFSAEAEVSINRAMEQMTKTLTLLERKEKEMIAQQKLVIDIATGTAKAVVEKVLTNLLPLLATTGAFVLWKGASTDQNSLIGLGLYGLLIEVPILISAMKRK